jgi:RNA polymerase sigma factor (sigma-70 family)
MKAIAVARAVLWQESSKSQEGDHLKGQLAPVLHYLYRVYKIGDEVDSDRHLLVRFAQHRDTAAFTSLVQRHGPMVLGVCRRILHDTHDADDAFQTTFLLLVRKASSLRNPERIGPWLHGVACRTAMKARSLRCRNRTRQQPLCEVMAEDSTDPAWRDLRPILDDAVRALPEKYREPFVLCYLEGLTNAEAARRLACPSGTVATRLSRARDLLRARLTRRGVTLSAAGLALALATGAATASVSPSLLAVVLRMITGGAISPSVSSLTKGVCKAMLMEKLRLFGFVMAVLLSAGAGLGWLVHHAQAFEPGAPPAAAQAPRTLAPPAVPIIEAPDDNAKNATVTTKNFAVTAATPRIARLVADVAERERKEKAILWLGKELPAWSAPCPLKVAITMNGAGGATSFEYDRGRVLSRNMHVEGSLDRLLASVIPHEVTHTILADHFGNPVPRWADEGASVLGEDDEERTRHDNLAKRLLDKPTRSLPLGRLFKLTEYPDDVMVVFAQGYSVTRFLVERKDHKTYLAFVRQGMRDGWDAAAKKCYGFEDVAEMEKAWINSLIPPPGSAYGDNRGPAEEKATSARNALPVIGVANNLVSNKYVMVRFLYGTRTVTSYRKVERDDRAYYEPQTTQIPIEQVMRVDLDAVPVYDTTGKRVAPKNVTELLKESAPVLVATDGKPVDPFYLKLVKEGTLIFVVPGGISVQQPITLPQPPPPPQPAGGN